MNTVISTQNGQELVVANSYLRELFEFIGVVLNRQKVEDDLLITPGEKEMSKLLKPSQIEIDVPDFTDKITLRDDLLKLKHAAAVIEAVFFREINPRGDVKTEIVERIKSFAKTEDYLDKNDDSTDFDIKIEQIERGFIDAAGIEDPINPYGDSFDNRPKIRVLGQEQGVDDGN